jgi:hypothetical protein
MNSEAGRAQPAPSEFDFVKLGKKPFATIHDTIFDESFIEVGV